MRVASLLPALAYGAVFDEMEADYTVVVPAGVSHCYFQPMTKGTAFEIEYQVLEGGDLDINFSLWTPSGQFLFNDARSEEGLHEVSSAEDGDYKICFGNEFSRMTDKTVFWEIFTEEEYDYDEEDYYDEDDYDDEALAVAKAWKDDLANEEATEGMIEEKVKEMQTKLMKMKTNLHRTSQFQSVLRAFEQKDRNVIEANLKRVNNWSTVHLGVMLTTALLQVFLLRSFFSAKPTASGSRAMT